MPVEISTLALRPLAGASRRARGLYAKQKKTMERQPCMCTGGEA